MAIVISQRRSKKFDIPYLPLYLNKISNFNTFVDIFFKLIIVFHFITDNSRPFQMLQEFYTKHPSNISNYLLGKKILEL